MEDAKDLLIEWLKNAHATELEAAKSLEGFLNDFKGRREAYSKISQHIQDTKDQAHEIEVLLGDLGEEKSTIKDLSGKTMGFVSGKTSPLAKDRLIKHAVMMHSMESLEYATYVTIEHIALGCAARGVAKVARAFMAEEQEMAEWVEEQIPILVDNVTEDITIR